MTDAATLATQNATLAAAMSSLAAAIRAMPQAAIQPKVYDPFKSNEPFDLSSRSGSMAYETISAPLTEIWDGDVSKFPSFVTELRIRAQEGKWDLDTDPGILTIASNNIFTHYHSITDEEIEDARTARTGDRAIQNAKAMFQCIKGSITGNLRDIIFNQYGNLPTHNDGIALFKQITTFSTVASIQLSMLSFQSILNFDPSSYDFNITTVNSKLCSLFTLATSSTRSLKDSERIQHTLTAYSKIIQPDTWARWVGNKLDSFEEGSITKCQDLMNMATIKYNKIINVSGKFNGSTKTIQEDIVAMLAHKHPGKRRQITDQDKSGERDDNPKPPRRDSPPFLTHFQSADKVKYKLGDKKDHNGTTFFFCDCPLHKNKLKWHTHHPDKCRLRAKWMKTKSSSDVVDNDATANVGENADSTSVADTSESSSSLNPSTSTDVQALLASAMNLVSDNDVLKDIISDALNASSTV